MYKSEKFKYHCFCTYICGNLAYIRDHGGKWFIENHNEPQIVHLSHIPYIWVSESPAKNYYLMYYVQPSASFTPLIGNLLSTNITCPSSKMTWHLFFMCPSCGVVCTPMPMGSSIFFRLQRTISINVWIYLEVVFWQFQHNF